VRAARASTLLNRNTPEGSRRNIEAHYDLGNEMFALFLDPTMMYSSAIFPHAGRHARGGARAPSSIASAAEAGPGAR
jgi:cyclopropane fatty-acyl-phospholipid synthase-like methyltransferase